MPIEHLFHESDGISGATVALMASADHFRGEVATQLGIGLSGLKALGLLHRYDGMTVGELAQAVDLTSGTMTATIDKLESQGLAVRRPSDVDRRSVIVLISLEGKQTMAWIQHHYGSALRRALEGTPDTDHDGVARYLTSAASSIRALADRIPDLDR